MFFFNSLLNLASTLLEYIEKEINDEGKLQQDLFETRLKYEMDELTEEEYRKTESHLMQRIREIREQKMKNNEEEE